MKIYGDSGGPPGTLYLPSALRSARESRKYLLGEEGYSLQPWSEDIGVEALQDLKEEVIRSTFSFISPSDMERLVAWHRKGAEELAPITFLALRQGELAGMAALEEESSACPLLSSGYGRKRGAVAALTALLISLAEQRGSVAMKAEVFRMNELGKSHLLRWGFLPTGESRRSLTSNQWIDIWSRKLRAL